MASTSTSGHKRKNEVDNMGAFDGIAPPASACATSSKQLKKPSYDVFINHRGPDVKNTLASAIYGVLTGMALSVFLDSRELEYGAFLPRSIEAAMASALFHIAIFSERYAESPWCLAELSFMLKSGTTIFPVFYHVDPSDLRWVAQGKGIYANAFKEHEKKGRYSLEQLDEWKKALHYVSFYTGQIIKTNDDEMRLQKNIVSCVLKVLKVPLVIAKHPVGLDEIVQDFEMNTLRSAQDDQAVRIVGIWGMGGSGKTTLAKELYNRISSSMEWSSFVFDVRDAADKGVLHNKQIKLLKDLGYEDVTFDNIEEGMGILSRRLRSVRVLIVLDDVDHVEQLDALLSAKDGLERGSLIIVTTRSYDVLKSWGISSTYKMRPLNPLHAEQLFCWHAFLNSCPPDRFMDLVKKFLKECNGLPLSLKVFGSQLYGEYREEYWESQLHKISRILPDDIKQRLKISYDALDDEEKEMFLDTACFFIGEESSLPIEVWNGLGWSGLHSWERLLHKCLVELDDNNFIEMHDHLRDLGRDIANQQSPYRIWFAQQIINVQKQGEKRIGIQGIMAASTEIQWINFGKERHLFLTRTKITGEVDEFPVCCSHGQLMVNTNGGIWSLAPSLVGIKFFVITGDYFNQVMGEVSRELVWLRWFRIGERSLPSRLPLKNLRVLELSEKYEVENHLEELWGETDGEAPVQLRQLVISGCQKFQGFPNSIGHLNHLKKIEIFEGYNVTSLPDEFCLLQSLEHLVLDECKMLSLPSNFGNLSNLRHLSLCSCNELRMLPVSLKNLMLLEYLNLMGCSQLTFTSEDLNILENMIKLEFLGLSRWKQLEELPRHITNQASLRELYLEGTSLRELPVNIGQLRRLREMSIGSVFLTSLPTSLGDLSFLTNLSIRGCPNLECLPDSLGDLSSLTVLSIRGCPKLECLPDSVGRLDLLNKLYMYNLGVKSLPKSVRQLKNLQTLYISHCPISELDLRVGSLPFAFSNLKSIHLQKTEVCMISISEDCCPCLENVYVAEHHHLREIEALPRTVKSISLVNCETLKNILSFATLTSLQGFELRGCYRIEKIEGLENCTRLESLRVDTCWEMPGIESFEHMEKLRRVKLRVNKGSAIEHCIQTIQKWPDEIEMCMRAVPDASSFVDSLLSPNLVVVDDSSNQKIKSRPKLVQKRSSNGDAFMLCFFINCVSSQMTLNIRGRNMLGDSYGDIIKVEKGRWAWIGIFTQRSKRSFSAAEEFSIGGYGGECEEENVLEKGLIVTGEEQRLMEAVRSLLLLL